VAYAAYKRISLKYGDHGDQFFSAAGPCNVMMGLGPSVFKIAEDRGNFFVTLIFVAIQLKYVKQFVSENN